MPLDLAARTFLKDIAIRCERIENYVRGYDVAAYLSDQRTQSAAERELITIGEAMGALLRIAPEIEANITDAREIVDFRNLVVHTYQIVIPRMVWAIIEDDLPTLHREVRALLA